MATSTIKVQNSNSGFTTEGLTQSNATVLRGGYVKIGKLIVINMRIKSTADITQWNPVMTGFPSTGLNEVPMTVDIVNKLNVSASLDITGNMLRCTTESLPANLEINLSGTYVQ